jgi:IS30 family transposase
MDRRNWSVEDRQELWRRWKAGESASDIGRAMGRRRSSVHDVLLERGGIAPNERVRRSDALQLREREEISRGVACGISIRQIARELKRAASSVSRELSRNGGASRYRACAAERRAWQRARRPKRCLLALHGRLRQLVIEKLRSNWSPEQISGYLARSFADDASMRVSHETIYRSLFIQARGVLKKQLLQHLRTHRRMRHTRAAANRLERRGQILDAVSIRERPAEVEERAIPGHWEGDLLVGTHNSHIVTLVERQSRFTMLAKLPSHDASTMVRVLSRHIGDLPAQLRGSLTWDRGKEMAAHKRFSVATDVQVYFCDPHSPWQRGSNENTNGLLRQYFPKGTDLSAYTQAQLNAVAKELNERPRKTLGFITPADKLNEVLH